MTTASIIQDTRAKLLGRRLSIAALVLGIVGVCVGCGSLVDQGRWAIPGGLLVAAGVVTVGFAAGQSLTVLLSTVALVQIPLGHLGPISSIQPAEIVVPLLLFGVALNAFAGRGPTQIAGSATVKTDRLARVLHLSVGAYGVVIVANAFRSEFLLNTTHALRPLYAYVVALGIYLLTYLTLRGPGNPLDRTLRFIFSLSVAVCAIGVGAVLLHLSLNLGSVQFSVVDYTSGAVRVGFLDTFGTAGLALAVVGIGGNFRPLAGLLFAAAIIASGGRSGALGIVLAVLLYLVVTWRPGPLLATAFVAVLVVLLLPSLERLPQVQRITNIGQSAVAANDRAPFLAAALHEFSRHPLFGTGMGVPAPEILGRGTKAVAFNKAQLEYGGQATYHSLLKLFGLAGFVPFVVAILAALWGLARIARRNVAAAFFFIFVGAQAVSMVAGGDGADPHFFFALGGGAAVLSFATRRDSSDAGHRSTFL